MRRIWFLSLIASYLLLSYYALGGWWNSSAGTLLIILFSYLVWHKDFTANTGLITGLKTVILSIALAVIVILCSFLVMKHIASGYNVTIQPTTWKNYYHDIFYTLNEEIVLGAIILFWLTRRKKIRPLWASTGLALVFALIHFVFCTGYTLPDRVFTQQPYSGHRSYRLFLGPTFRMDGGDVRKQTP
jgi:hypothetical protein